MTSVDGRIDCPMVGQLSTDAVSYTHLIMAKSQVKIQQTAGRDALGEFAPEFARLNDDILFGEVWSRNDLLSLSDRSIVTVVALMSQGLTDSSFKYHIESFLNRH